MTADQKEREAPPGIGKGAKRSLLERIGHGVFRRRILVLVAVVVAIGLALPFGSDVTERLSEGGITATNAEATRADNILNKDFKAGAPHLVFLVKTPGSVEDPAAVKFGTELTDRLAKESGVVQAESFWSLNGAPPLRGEDSKSAMVLVRLAGDENEVSKATTRIVPNIVGKRDGFTVEATGVAQVRAEVNTQSDEDLVRAELIAAPLTLLILLLVFRGVIAALTPLAVGGLAVVGALVMLKVFNMMVPVSVFAVNITIALGLGLAIDYSLFILTRFREELASGSDVKEAIGTTVRTAGRTVVFSALTVAVSMSSLLLFPMNFLRSFAYAGISVVALAALGAVVVLPALLSVLGRKVDALSLQGLFRSRKKAAQTDGSGGFWHRWSLIVMKRPLPFFLIVTALLLVVGSPFLGAKFGESDDRVLPPDAPAHVAAQYIRDNYASKEDSPLTVVLPGVPAQADSTKIGDYATKLSQVSGVTRVDAATGSYIKGEQVAPPDPSSARFDAQVGTWVSIISEPEPYSPQGGDLVAKVRDLPSPSTDRLVGGQAAQLVDARVNVGGALPWVLLFIAVTTFILLFLFTGSLLIPLQAIFMNLLSLTATFGAMVFIFQEGHLRWLVGDFIVTDNVNIRMPILMFCVAFGVSMDYQVFMLSRIKEHHELTGDNVASVAGGLERVGRLVTAAAVIVAVVLFAFATSGLTPVKLLGVGLAIAVIVDATLIRGALMPALMRMCGDGNWWLPGWLRAFHNKFGLSEAR
ncbi:putative drug exporter of the RND superfamily [Lentzea albidocapillata subsp. violacea]|uniref:Putative drug exporter of the RND superfamily n=1 Tax=Lentzea albidocapillata subsp. violacea TaxID=128104 RepID=A0A1G9RXY3_9PSEU|nr:MMPL family transporter [Lentzea albidocapillata]SDM27887.1 putative drug exporter of the RND superfamily [Lentzea albidocapillata subsp. violacea]